eukprot:m.150559 g.150559  ORF g.150559 m.150559 type:complete len:550 (-) comp10147_c0_seq2:24-1673(-)
MCTAIRASSTSAGLFLGTWAAASACCTLPRPQRSSSTTRTRPGAMVCRLAMSFLLVHPPSRFACCCFAGVDYNIKHVTLMSPTARGSSVVNFWSRPTHRKDAEALVDQEVRRVRMLPTLNVHVSCANTTSPSVVVQPLEDTTNSSGAVEFTIPRGTSSFDFNEEARQLVTGGGDCQVRVWNPFVPTQPICIFKGHASPVVDVRFNKGFNQVISISVNDTIKIWDVKDQVCLNTLVGIIPHPLATVPKPVSCCIWHENSQSLITGSFNSLAIISIVKDEHQLAVNTTHDSPISAAIYVPQVDQVVTACTGGVIRTWRASDGTELLRFSDAHSGAPITALASGFRGKRLASAASNGTIFVWNILNGLALQRLVKVDPVEVSAITFCGSKVLAVGWDRKLSVFRVGDEIDLASTPVLIQQDTSLAQHVSHEGDILAMDLNHHLLATGSVDGIVFIWNIRMGVVEAKLDAHTIVKHVSAGVRQTGQTGDIQLAEVTSLKPAVDAVLWLLDRASSPSYGGATLVTSSHGGVCCCCKRLSLAFFFFFFSWTAYGP